MAISFDRFMTSAPFKFVVGRDETPFTIHSALIAHHSNILDTLVNGQMSEAMEGCARLEDIDKDTFVRFSEYMYTGDYQAADPEIVLGPSEVAPDDQTDDGSARRDLIENGISQIATGVYYHNDHVDVADEEGGWGTLSTMNKKKKKKVYYTDGFDTEQSSKKSQLWAQFAKPVGKYPIPKSRLSKSEDSYEDYTEVFLCHARIYVFADKYDIGPLRNLALRKLRNALVKLSSYDVQVDSVSRLLEYTCLNTADRETSTDDLRILVTHYAACVVEILSPSHAFRLLLQENGSFARDLVCQMIRRLD